MCVCLTTSGFFLTFSKKLKPKKPQRPKKLNDFFQGKTQRTGSNSSHMNFRTYFIFSTFAVNEQKVLLFAKRAKKMPYLVHF